MTGSFVYTNFKYNSGKKLENLPTDSLKLALFTSSYTPNPDTDCAYAVAAPAAPTLSQTPAGALAATTYFVKITYVNAAGETTPSAEASLAVSVNNVLVVTSPSNPGGSVTGYNVYVSTSTGTETKQNGGTPIAIGTNWTEPTSGLVSGAALPGSNTAQISGEVTTGSGYTQGGVALASVAWASVLANNWTGVWAALTAYSLGKIIRPSTGNGYLYKCVAAGTSGGSAPTWGTTVGGLTTDGSVTWLNIGTSVAQLTANNVAWTVSGVITYRYAVLYDAATNDLIALFDPLSNQSGPSSGTININWDATNGVMVFG